MSDEPLARNARQLVQLLLQHGSLTSKSLQEQFEEKTSLRSPQSFYSALQHCKKMAWVTGGGYRQPLSLSLNGTWQEPDIASIGASVGASRDKSELEYLIGTQTQQINGLQSEVERLRGWSDGSDVDGAGIATSSGHTSLLLRSVYGFSLLRPPLLFGDNV